MPFLRDIKLQAHPLFSKLNGCILPKTTGFSDKNSVSYVTKNGDIALNQQTNLSASEWAHVLAHHLLHLAFGHFDKDKMPSEEQIHPLVWNKACDIYVERFLADVSFGKSLCPDPASVYSIKLNDERKIYDHLLQTEGHSPQRSHIPSNRPSAMQAVITSQIRKKQL